MISDEIRDRVLELHNQGESLGEISKQTGVPKSSVSRVIAEAEKGNNQTSTPGEFIDSESRFISMLTSYGLKDRDCKRIASYVSTLGPSIYSDPQALRVALLDQGITPAKGSSIVKHWGSQEGLPIPTEKEKREPLDPLEEMAQTMQKAKFYQEVLGGGNSRLPPWMSDPFTFMKTFQDLAGGQKGDEETKRELAELRNTLQQMQESQHQQEMAGLRSLIGSQNEKIDALNTTITELKKPQVGMTEIDLLSQVASKGFEEMHGLRSDVRGFVENQKPLPTPKTAEQREQQIRRLKQATQADREIQALGEGLGFGPAKPAPSLPVPIVYE